MPTFIDPNDPNGQNAQNNDEQNTESTSRRHDTNRRSKDNDYTPYLKSIDDSLKQILKDGINVSQSNARTFRDTQQFNRNQRNNSRNNRTNDNSKYDPRKQKIGSFGDEFEKVFMENFLGSDYEKKIKNVFNNLADGLGVSVKDIPGAFGREMGKKALGALKNTDLGKNIESKINSYKDKALNFVKDRFNSGYNSALGNTDPESQIDAFSRLFNEPRRQATEEQEARDNAEASRRSQEAEASQRQDDFDSAVFQINADAVNISAEYVVNKIQREENDVEMPSADGALDTISNVINSPVDDMASTIPEIAEGAASTAETTALTTTATASETEMALGGLAETAGAAEAGAGAVASGMASLAGPLALGVVGLIALDGVLDLAEKAFKAMISYVTGPLIDGFKKYMEGMKQAANRDQEQQHVMLENEQERIKADVRTLVEEPFNILKKAAQEWFDFWDSNMHTINQTQGYSKADLQDLMSSYAQRLRDEGLTNVVSSASIGDNLAKVIESGLTGPAAEEFAYLATVLEAAVPTQDFFSYADQYASLTATAIQAGKSQQDAIAYANQQLEEFASSVIYSSRMTGGFAAGLKDAGSLLSDAVAISQASKTGNVSQIAGLLTSISGVVGSIAPDLASGLVDQVVKSAIGGNATDLVALRSLAGINASNTDFLRALATDPQGLFVTIFRNLSKYQNMAPDAYMEVAEGLSSVFGISQDAFARVDFNYLADQIAKMNVNTGSLEENLKLLSSGESTTTTEQLRMQQINKYMIEEGLSYVLDNEAARAIQEHMWDEQIANEIKENEYAVNLKGAALDFLQGISDTINNLLNILNPFNWGKKLANVIATSAQATAQDADLLQMLERGKVGQGNAQELYQLVTRGQKLNLIDPLVQLMGGISTSSAISAGINAMSKNPLSYTFSLAGTNSTMGKLVETALGNLNNSSTSGSFGSRTSYSWGSSVTKAQAAAVQSITSSLSGVTSRILAETDAKERERAALAEKVNKMIESNYMYGKFVKEGKSYEEWVESSKNFGIKDWNEALEAAGINEQDLRKQYQAYETQEGSAMKQAEWDDQWDFRAKSREFYIAQIDMDEEMIDRLDIIIENQRYFIDAFKNYVNVWLRYFVLHEVYDSSIRSYDKLTSVQQKEKAGEYDAITALAESLSSNLNDFRDPAVQTNALLGQILLVLQGIREQHGKEANANNFLDSLMSLSTGQGTV